MKHLFVLTSVACFALLTFSQTPSSSSANRKCSLTREQAPEIRGVRLGMSTDQLQNLFPDDKNRQRISDAVKAARQVDQFGVGKLELWPEKQVDNPRLAGVNYISVGLLDDRVTSFHVAYFGPEWKNIDQFITRLSEGLRLPASAWEIGDVSGQMKCDGFKVEAYTNRGSPESIVRVQDVSTYQIVEDRREAAKEKVRQAFKP